jgi:hypothetical protein
MGKGRGGSSLLAETRRPKAGATTTTVQSRRTTAPRKPVEYAGLSTPSAKPGTSSDARAANKQLQATGRPSRTSTEQLAGAVPGTRGARASAPVPLPWPARARLPAQGTYPK